ncbi:MAG: hypothetical protein N4A74_21880, partial [Carboxylicivirga sp.]|nr:hypothetical protein [Carboxylicivirga sp.]
MIKTVQLFLFFCILFGGTNSALSQNTDRIDSAFIKLEKLPPMEKLYLHTDKTTYAAGGTIWLKAYLVSVTGHLPLVGSQFVYVELYDNTATLIKRIKIKNSNDVFAGQINLPQNLQEGNYCLKAYTTWMLNQGDDFLFRKMIRIQNIKSPNYTTSIHFDRKPDKQHATVIFKDKNGEPAARKRIQCTLPLGDNQSKIFYRNTGLDGSINFSLDVDSNMTNQHIDVLVMEDEHQFRKRFDQPLHNEAFDLQFFPEGGNLIHGQAAKVAFKAIGTDGLHRKVAGCILNEKNDTIQRFNSAHKGMGTFLLVPDSLTQYKAIAWLENGQKQIFHFPEVLNAGVSLTVAQLSKQLKVAIKASGSDLPHPYYLIAHSGEKIILKQQVDRLLYSIDKNLLPEGIINFVLIDGFSRAVSSRLVFIHKSDAVELEAKTHKEDYSKREEVVIDLNMGSAAWGTHLSISVTDNEVVNADSLANNIKSCLLLTSDLKGYVEDPNYYFLNRNNDTKLHLDNLMLTQGWRRFDINSIMKNPIRPKYYLEMGQTISGKFTRGLIRKSNDTPITAISIDPPLFATTVSDEKGNFLFNGLNFKDSTVFTIQSQKYTAIR